MTVGVTRTTYSAYATVAAPGTHWGDGEQPVGVGGIHIPGDIESPAWGGVVPSSLRWLRDVDLQGPREEAQVDLQENDNEKRLVTISLYYFTASVVAASALVTLGIVSLVAPQLGKPWWYFLVALAAMSLGLASGYVLPWSTKR